jgi:hypothetical protein
MNNLSYIIDRNNIHYISLCELTSQIDDEISKIDKREINIFGKFNDLLTKLCNFITDNYTYLTFHMFFTLYDDFRFSHSFILTNNNTSHIMSYTKFDENMIEKYVYITGNIICYDDYPNCNLARHRIEYTFMNDNSIKFQERTIQFFDTYHIQ